MTLQQLKYAQALAKEGNYGRAAKNLGISQPALSLQIKKLEQELGFVIIDRSKKKVSITEKGVIFLDRAKLLINESQQLKSLAHKLNDEYRGNLKIGIIPTLAPYLLPLFIHKLKTAYQGLRIHIKEALTTDIIEDIKAGRLDGGIIATPMSSGVTLSITPLFYEAFMLYVSSQHELYNRATVRVKDIAFQDVWLLSEGNCFRNQVNNICEIADQQTSSTPFRFESSSIESLCRIVESEGGITFLPELSTIHISSDREDLIKTLEGDKPVRELSMVSLPNHIARENLDLLASIITDSIPKHMLQRGSGATVPTGVRV